MTDYRKYEPFFNAWHIVKKIGSGNFGEVYEVERREFDKVYKSAIKIISIPKSEDEKRAMQEEVSDDVSLTAYYDSAVKTISDEVAIMSDVRGHSNIVSYEDHEVIKHEDGIGYDIIIRMELLTLLADYQKTHAMGEKEVIKLGIDICNALEICSKKNILHRDIKPSNIFVSDTGDFKLGDFGIARTIESTTSELSKKGTYTYMAPEVYVGKQYDARADIYSLGLVMYTLMNKNRLPFYPLPPEPVTYSLKENAIRMRLSGERLPYPAACSRHLGDIIMKACSYSPEKRYKSATEFRDALKALVNNDSSDYDNTVNTGEVSDDIYTDPSASPTDPYQGTTGYQNLDQNGSYGTTSEMQAQFDDAGNGVQQNNTNRIIIICAALVAALLIIGIIGGLLFFGNKGSKQVVKEDEEETETVSEVSEENIQVFDYFANFPQVSLRPGSDNYEYTRGGERRTPKKNGVDVLMYVRNDNDEDIVKMEFNLIDFQSDTMENRDKEQLGEPFVAYGYVRSHDSGYMYAKIKVDNKYAAFGRLNVRYPDRKIQPVKVYPGEPSDNFEPLFDSDEADVHLSENEEKYKNTNKYQYYTVRFKNTGSVKLHKGQSYVVILKNMKNYNTFDGRWGAGVLREDVEPGELYKDNKALYNPQMGKYKGKQKRQVIVFDEVYLEP